MRLIASCVLALLIGSGSVLAESPKTEAPSSEQAYLAKVRTAAPEQIVGKATIVVLRENAPDVLQTGSNGFTCLVDPTGTPLCADQNGLEWLKAVGAKQEPANKVGFIYMLAGDTGTSNHDPYQRSAHEHWVQTGPHVMIVGPMVREMPGYPRSMDVADASQPYVMFPGTPYEHLMLPVTNTASTVMTGGAGAQSSEGTSTPPAATGGSK